MPDLDKYLAEIQDDYIQEFEPITTGLAISSVIAIGSLITILVSTAAIKKDLGRFKPNKEWSSKLNTVLGSNEWKVHLIKDKLPNAFTIGGRHVFITYGAFDLLTEREIIAFLIHEAYHDISNHVPKSIAYKFPFLFMVLSIALTTGFAAGGFLVGSMLAYLIWTLLKGIPDAAVALISGKRFEKEADKYTIKFGYGDDLISALKKIERYYQKRVRGMPCGIICKASRKLDEIIDEHPPTAKRIEVILKKQKELAQVVKTANFKKIKNFITGEFKK